MSDVEEPPTKLTKMEDCVPQENIETTIIEDETMLEEGQEEWLSDGVLTDDEYNTTVENGKSEPILENKPQVNEEENLQKCELVIEKLDSSAGSAPEGTNKMTDSEREELLQKQKAHEIFVLLQQRSIEATLNDLDGDKTDAEDMNSIIINKETGQIIQTYKTDWLKSIQSDNDGNDTDDLLRMLGEDESKIKKKVKTNKDKKPQPVVESSDEDDDLVSKGGKPKTSKVAKSANVSKYPAVKAVPEHMSDGDDEHDLSSDEANTIQKNVSVEKSKDNDAPKRTANTLSGAQKRSVVKLDTTPASKTTKPVHPTPKPNKKNKSGKSIQKKVDMPKSENKTSKKPEVFKGYHLVSLNPNSPKSRSLLKKSEPAIENVEKHDELIEICNKDTARPDKKTETRDDKKTKTRDKKKERRNKKLEARNKKAEAREHETDKRDHKAEKRDHEEETREHETEKHVDDAKALDHVEETLDENAEVIGETIIEICYDNNEIDDVRAEENDQKLEKSDEKAEPQIHEIEYQVPSDLDVAHIETIELTDEMEEVEDLIEEEEFLEEDYFDMDEMELAKEANQGEPSQPNQELMKPESMDEEVPSDVESRSEHGSLYDELPSSASDDEEDWFTVDIRSERAGDYLPLLGTNARDLLLQEKRRVTARLEVLKQSLKSLTDNAKKQSDEIREATVTLAELDDLLKIT